MRRTLFARLAPWLALLLAGQSQAQGAAVPLDQAAADRYAGYYLVRPEQAMRFWREGDAFYFNTMGTSQRAQTVVEGPNRFSYNNGLITLSFNSGANGEITGLTVNRAGTEIIAPRIDEATAKSLSARGATAPARPPVARSWPVMAHATLKAITSPMPGTMDYWPCFSPDGKTVLFSRTRDNGRTWALFRVPAAGGKAEAFTRLAVSATRSSWSSANRIVFNAETPDGKGLTVWAIDGDGHNPHAIATGEVLAPSYPYWYPDGKAIGFSDAATNTIYRMNVDDGRPVAITTLDQVLTGMSAVSPDGKWVAFAGQKNNGQSYDQGGNQLWLVDDNGVVRSLEATPLQGRTPAWSPDGRRLAFEASRGSSNGLYAVFIINRDGSGLVQVTDYAVNANHPVFSPDGRSLVIAIGDPSAGTSSIAVVELTDAVSHQQKE